MISVTIVIIIVIAIFENKCELRFKLRVVIFREFVWSAQVSQLIHGLFKLLSSHFFIITHENEV